jgi:flagellar protein FliO/FliZ
MNPSTPVATVAAHPFADFWPIVVMLCILVCLPWLIKELKKSGWKGLQPKSKTFTVHANLNIGPQQRLLLVEVMHNGQSKQLILGISAQGIVKLDEFVQPAAAEPSLPFSTQLAQQLQPTQDATPSSISA